MNEAERSDKVGFMKEGRVLIESCPEILKTKYSVKNLDKAFYALCLETEEEKNNTIDLPTPTGLTQDVSSRIRSVPDHYFISEYQGNLCKQLAWLNFWLGVYIKIY